MKHSIYTIALTGCLFFLFLGCSQKPNHSRKPVSSIVVKSRAKNYYCGQMVSVHVKTKVKNGEIKHIRLYHQSKLLKESKELNFTVDSIPLNFVGKNTLKVIATKTDSVSNSRTISINVVSDIKPKSYTFRTVNDFPHNQDFFTQGLEFHKGYLYEGTGQKGSSGLFKVHLNSGTTLQQYLLEEQYFGEGITILNDKIYQLTYRAQKGFVYNLSDFSRIDSFRYQSEEGWGLTNDGKNLIMSNGTNELLWLDLNDFSVVKKIEVANHRGIINNLNELEYIEGSVYANVYTTNLIIEIDPETGKVLSEINLEGILNMYTNPSETIDYLNGIAYDEGKDRIFVTGKWWPRIFEIEPVSSE